MISVKRTCKECGKHRVKSSYEKRPDLKYKFGEACLPCRKKEDERDRVPSVSAEELRFMDWTGSGFGIYN